MAHNKYHYFRWDDEDHYYEDDDKGDKDHYYSEGNMYHYSEVETNNIIDYLTKKIYRTGAVL